MSIFTRTIQTCFAVALVVVGVLGFHSSVQAEAGDVVSYAWTDFQFNNNLLTSATISGFVSLESPDIDNLAQVRIEWGTGNPYLGNEYHDMIGVSDPISVQHNVPFSHTITGLASGNNYYISLIEYRTDPFLEINLSIENQTVYIFETTPDTEVSFLQWDYETQGDNIVDFVGNVDVSNNYLVQNVQLQVEYGFANDFQNQSDDDYIDVTPIFNPNINGAFQQTVDFTGIDFDSETLFYADMYQVFEGGVNTSQTFQNLSVEPQFDRLYFYVVPEPQGPFTLTNFTVQPATNTLYLDNGFVMTGTLVDSNGQPAQNVPLIVELSSDENIADLQNIEMDVTDGILSGPNGWVNVFLSPVDYGSTYYIQVTDGQGQSVIDPAVQEITLNQTNISLPIPGMDDIIVPTSGGGQGAGDVGFDFNNAVPSGGLVPPECQNGFNCDFNSLLTLVNNVVNFILILSFPVLAVVIAWVGFLFLSSGGDSGRRSKAKQVLMKTIIGFIVLLAAWLIIKGILLGLGYQGDLLTIFN